MPRPCLVVLSTSIRRGVQPSGTARPRHTRSVAKHTAPLAMFAPDRDMSTARTQSDPARQRHTSRDDPRSRAACNYDTRYPVRSLQARVSRFRLYQDATMRCGRRILPVLRGSGALIRRPSGELPSERFLESPFLAFFLSETSPSAVGFGRFQRVVQACRSHWTAIADQFGGTYPLRPCFAAFVVRMVEDCRVGATTCSGQLPVPRLGDRRR
jgi:hypothetical protein